MMNHVGGCFRFNNKDHDDMRLEWDAYIDSSSSGDTTGLQDSSPCHHLHHHPDMMDRVPGLGYHGERHRVIEGYRDAPCQPLLASRGTYLGQLKLSIYVNSGLLTCHVIQSRHLASKHNPSCDAYVKLSLVPDESMRTKCKTDVVLDTNNPLFDEKFSFELLEEDMKKRIYISIWNKVRGKECKDEFLGCMSFGIRHIQSERRAVNGWYYLLTEEVGRRKHLQALVKKQELREQSSNTNNNGIPKVNQDIMWMDPYTISITKKSKSGYGFTVSGFSPVFVCKVEKGSHADEAGLLKDDCIVRIDGLNVSRSTSDSVAKLIRNTSKQITMEIQRPQVVTAMDIVPTAFKPWEAVASTPMTRGAPPVPHVPGAPIPSQPSIHLPHYQHHHQQQHQQQQQLPLPNPPVYDRWNLEIESKEPIYGNCGVFGESDPLYSTVTMETPHSSASSSSSHDPPYGMIKVPRSKASSSVRTTTSGCSTNSAGTLHTSGHSSSGCSYHSNNALYSNNSPNHRQGGPVSLPSNYSVCTLPRSRNSVAMSQNVAYRFPKSQSMGTVRPVSTNNYNAIVNSQYRIYHDPEAIYGSVASSQTSGKMSSNTWGHDDSGIYGYLRMAGSVGSAGSAHSGDSGNAALRSKTLPRQKKKVHFQ